MAYFCQVNNLVEKMYVIGLEGVISRFVFSRLAIEPGMFGEDGQEGWRAGTVLR